MTSVEACQTQDPIIRLNVGGSSFTTSRDTLVRDSGSMLARMFSGVLKSRLDVEGRVFVDRDPKHFRLILNFLRDGFVALPACSIELQEIKTEAEFYQLEELRSLIVSNQHWKPQWATQLRASIAQCIQCDKRLRDALETVLDCAYGRLPYGDAAAIPASCTCVDVCVRESAYNALHPQHQLQGQDETLYVAFQQHIQIKGETRCELYDAKHESHLLHEDGHLSYDPAAYGSDRRGRFHIKTMDVYRHHCVGQLSQQHKRLRDCALHIAANVNAMKWALELYGFQDVSIHIAAVQTVDKVCGGCAPVLCNVRFSIHLSL